MKIAIVGGGTAGWLAALMIKKVQQESHDVVVIESEKIGIIGAGEGSTGYLTDIIQGNTWDYGCNEADFFRETNATVKLGILHRDWKQLDHEYIAPLDGAAVSTTGTDYLLMHALLNDHPMHAVSDDGYYIEKNWSSFFWENGKIDNTKSHAYHFDGHLVGKYFKKVCGDSVKTIDAQVVDVALSQNGYIESVKLDDGQIVEADFFIDASGFAKLFSKKLDVPWISYSDFLPVDTAIPFILPPEEEIAPVTTAWAQKYGWMWMIPIQNRRGCGYVYDGSFISEDEAKKEIEQQLGHEIDPIKVIKFDTGRQAELWKKNCLFIGLSAAFAEPLEATSIHSTIMQLNSFVFHYLKDTRDETCNTGCVNRYNRKMGSMYDDFKDFLSVHYAGKRTDSEFWKMMSSGERLSPMAKDIIDMQKTKIVSPNDLDHYFGYAGAALYNWVLAGLGYIGKEEAERELSFYGQHELGRSVWELNSNSRAPLEKIMIKNTEFVHKVKEYADGNYFSK